MKTGHLCVDHLGDGDSTLFGELLFGFFAGVRVGQVGVEVLIQDLCGLFAEIASLASDENKSKLSKQRGLSLRI